jgi:hypothetical protein
MDLPRFSKNDLNPLKELYFLQKPIFFLPNMPGEWYLLLKTAYPAYLSIRNGLFVNLCLGCQSVFTTKTHIMKKLIILLLIAISFNSLHAQDNSSATGKTNIKKIYLQAGAGGSSQAGSYSEIGLQAIVNNKWSATVSYHNLTMKPKNLPGNYQPESGTIFFIPYTNEIYVNMKLFSLTAGKYFSLGRNSWFTTEAGLSFVSGEKASFQPATPVSIDQLLLLLGTSGTTSNYTTTIEKKNSFGGMLRADINWAFCSFMGLGAGVFANFNSIQSPVGFQLKLTLGAMGRHKKTKKIK